MFPFLKSPLWTSHKGYLIVCEQCGVVNGQLKSEDVHKLARNELPKSLYLAHPPLHQFYSLGFYDANKARFVGDPPDPRLTPLFVVWMSTYRLEL